MRAIVVGLLAMAVKVFGSSLWFHFRQEFSTLRRRGLSDLAIFYFYFYFFSFIFNLAVFLFFILLLGNILVYTPQNE